MKPLNKNILTVAIGKPLYLDLAVNLARSFFYWHPDTEIQFQIVTDLESRIPEDLKAKIKIISVQPGELGEGFTPKLHLDRLAQEGQTLFIDSDCLIFENIESVFDKFKGHSVSVIGGYISTGEWFGDVAEICTKFKIPCYPKFNGGIYYLEKGETASKVYKRARELEKYYDEIGFVRFRGHAADEVLMALAMQLNGQVPIPDDGTIISDPFACPGKYYVNIINGERWLTNPPSPNPRHQHWYPFTRVSPLVVHFLGNFTNDYPYKREVFRLKNTRDSSPNFIHECLAKLIYEYPEVLKINFKNMLRPLYRMAFGVRKVKATNK